MATNQEHLTNIIQDDTKNFQTRYQLWNKEVIKIAEKYFKVKNKKTNKEKQNQGAKNFAKSQSDQKKNME